MPLTKQEMFDKAVEGIRAQDGPSITSLPPSCRYRTTDGRKCTIGHLIPPELYNSDMEGQGADKVAARLPGVFGAVTYELEEFLEELQQVHDSVADSGRGFWHLFEGKAWIMARKWGLQYTPPEVPHA